MLLFVSFVLNVIYVIFLKIFNHTAPSQLLQIIIMNFC